MYIKAKKKKQHSNVMSNWVLGPEPDRPDPMHTPT